MKWLRKFCRKHKRFLIVFIIILIIFVGFIAGSVLYNKHIESQMATIADKFHPNSSWRLEASSVTSTYPACIGIDEPCPYLVRSWKLSRPMTKQEFAKKLEAAGWHARIKSDCLPNPQFGGYGSVCNASLNDSGYTVQIYYSADPEDNSNLGVEINVQKQNK